MSSGLSNRGSISGVVEEEVAEEDVSNDTPSATSRDASTFIRPVLGRGLELERPDPRLDVGAVANFAVVWDNRNVVELDILDRAVFEVLAKRTDGHPVPTMANRIADVDVVAAWLDSDAVITALVDEILKNNVLHVHGVEAVRVLDPILAERCVDSRRVASDSTEVHVGAVHNVQAPELWILDIEVCYCDIRDIPLVTHVSIDPERQHRLLELCAITTTLVWARKDLGTHPDKGHRAAGLCEILLDIVPGVAVSIDAAGAVAVNADVLPADNETGMVLGVS